MSGIINTKSGGKSKKKLRIPQTKRKTHTRSDGTRVKATTVHAHYIHDKGAPGRTPKSKQVLPKPTSCVLKGYSTSMPQNERRKALSRLAKLHGSSLKVARDVQLLANYTKRSAPESYRKYKIDADYMFRRYEEEKEKKSKSSNKIKSGIKNKVKRKSKLKRKTKKNNKK